MPEGDTVFRTARRLDEALAGADATRFDLRVPQAATIDLTGQPIHGAVSRGKHLLLRVGDSTLHSHLRMDGAWFIYRPGEKWRHPAFKVRAIVGTAERDAVGVDLAEIEVVPTRDEAQLVGYLGPDPLAEDWDPAEAVRRLSADTRSIHVALLDQRNVAGFGNEYAAELLFLRESSRPGRRLRSMPPPSSNSACAPSEPTAIALGARSRASIDPGQATWVYGRAGKPCRRCGTLIRRGEQGADPTRERITFWCPSCQR